MTDECQKELEELGREMARREQEIIDNWLKTHEPPRYGVIEPEKCRALVKEECRRVMEILKKYGEYKG